MTDASNSPARRAVLHTNHGDITVDLFPDHAPKTVANFADLAEGRREWTHPETRQKTTDPLYDGTIFHRVICGFMIQGGDPLGQGFGGPGYQFGDEFHPELAFDRPYLLAMANAGPGTNGSQFFITVGPTPHLNRKHTIFGEVADQAGRDVVDAIAKVPTGRNDRARRRRRHRVRRGPAQLTEHQPAPPTTTCYRHPDRPTGIACVRCDRPICPECMIAGLGRASSAPSASGRGGPRSAPRGAAAGCGPRGAGGVRSPSALIAVNVAMFLVTAVSAVLVGASPLEQLPLPGVRRSRRSVPVLVQHGEWWRLLTAAFLHVGPLHLRAEHARAAGVRLRTGASAGPVAVPRRST